VALVLIRAPHDGSALEFIPVGFGVLSVVVSDTVLRPTALRRTVLRQALLSYLFGTGIVATAVNLVASPARLARGAWRSGGLWRTARYLRGSTHARRSSSVA
jgi:hypothetical protein